MPDGYDDEDDIPDFMLYLPPPSDAEVWGMIRDRFEELRDVISSVHLETKQQAVRQRHGMTTVDKGIYWEDPEAGGNVRAWSQIPFDPSRDEERFIEVWNEAKRLATKLAPKVSEQKTDVQFLLEWGAFCQNAGIVEAEYLRERPNLQHLKGAASQSREQHKRWYAHVFVSLRKQGEKRVDTDRRVLGHIYGLIESDEFPDPDFPKAWFEQFIGKNTDDLTRAFQGGQFSLAEIESLTQSPTDDLPFLANTAPTPRG